MFCHRSLSKAIGLTSCLMRKTCFAVVTLLVSIVLAGAANAQAIYSEGLEGNWQNWSWETTVNLSNTNPVQAGSLSIAATYDSAYAGLYLSTPVPVAVQSGDEIRFQLNGGEGGQAVDVFVADGNFEFLFVESLTLTSNTWTEVVIDIDEVGAPDELSGLIIQDSSGDSQSTFYIDAVEFGDFEVGSPQNPGAGPAIDIDPGVIGRAINDEIYGMNFADTSLAVEIGLAVHRWGGNSTSRYNYTNNFTNAGSDFFFENFEDHIDGQTSDEFVLDNMTNGAATIMTIGMLDYVSKASDEILGGYSVSLYGDQQVLNMYRPDHGNGIRLDGTRITDNDPLDTSVAVTADFAEEWVEHNVSQFGTAAQTGVKYYALGNEPMLWNHTHMDVHSEAASYDEVLDQGITYASAIKAADPSAQVLGPVLWGWTAYFYSALDAAPGGEWYFNPLDRNAHGGTPFVEWYLQQMAAHEDATGQRLLDYLDLHYYPQQEGVALATAGDVARQDLRLESTRSLWDPSYTDNSWINEQVMLIPRMRNWVDTHYPGTKLALTEYNFGGFEHINGAVTQADVLGIFGREGLDLATIWTAPDPDEPVAYAFRMYRNYDGLQQATSQFGSTSVQAVSADAAQVSAFAAVRDVDNALTVMLINKQRQSVTTPLTFAGLGSASAEVYVYGTDDLLNIRQLPAATISNDTLSIELEPSSITMLEIDSLADVILGDVNIDGVVDFSDIGPFIRLLSTGSFLLEADINGDGMIDFSDIGGFISLLAG